MKQSFAKDYLYVATTMTSNIVMPPFGTKRAPQNGNHYRLIFIKGSNSPINYSDVSIKNIDILPNRQYIANTADLAQEQYS